MEKLLQLVESGRAGETELLLANLALEVNRKREIDFNLILKLSAALQEANRRLEAAGLAAVEL